MIIHFVQSRLAENKVRMNQWSCLNQGSKEICLFWLSCNSFNTLLKTDLYYAFVFSSFYGNELLLHAFCGLPGIVNAVQWMCKHFVMLNFLVLRFGRNGRSYCTQIVLKHCQVSLRMALERLQLTLAIIKPHVCQDAFSLQVMLFPFWCCITSQCPPWQTILNMIKQNGFYFIRSKKLEMTRLQAQQFYQEHQGNVLSPYGNAYVAWLFWTLGKFFFNRLVSMMSSGQCSVHALARVDAISKWRSLMGPTKVYRCVPKLFTIYTIHSF